MLRQNERSCFTDQRGSKRYTISLWSDQDCLRTKKSGNFSVSAPFIICAVVDKDKRQLASRETL